MDLTKHKISILIPSIRPNVDTMKEDIRKTTQGLNVEIISSNIVTHASMNRNWCILHASKDSDIFIFLDDDVTGFREDWVQDLLKPLIENPDKISMIAARLLTRDSKPSGQLGDCGEMYDDKQDYQIAVHTKQTGLNITCSAVIAYFKNDIMWDEDYLLANYEDASFCMEFGKKFPNKKIVINNRCCLVHLGESKMKTNEASLHNKNLFAKKWGIEI
jgi:hypothetical protein